MSVILITGASRGLGLALTRACLERNHTVIATARDPASAPGLHTLANSPLENRLTVLDLDVTDDASVRAAAARVREKHGTLDVLVNNAAVHPEAVEIPLESLDLAHFGTAFETNVTGVMRVCQAFLPLLERGSNPRIVNVSSGAGSIATRDEATRWCYGASKAALNHVTRSLAHALRSRGITVVALSPGWVRTDMGGPEAELSPEESAGSMAEAIDNLKPMDSGEFLDRFGHAGHYAW